MLEWLVDHAYLFYLALGFIGLLLIARWWLTRQRTLLIALGIVASLAVLVFLLTLFIDSDQKQLDRIVHEMSGGVKKGALDRTFAHISEKFQTQGRGIGINKSQLRKFAEDAIKNYGIEEVTVWQVEVEHLQRPNATVSFMAKAGGYSQFFLVRANFVREGDGHWRMVDFKLFNPVVDTNQPLQWP
jgi:hypothetical protein